MRIKEYKFISKLKKINGETPELYFDSFGLRPLINKDEHKSMRPFIIFYLDGYYYYLLYIPTNNDYNERNLTDEELKDVIIISTWMYSNCLPTIKAYLRVNQIFRISKNDLEQIVDFNILGNSIIQSLLESEDPESKKAIHMIKSSISKYLNKNPKEIILLEVKIENKQLKSEPLYVDENLLKIGRCSKTAGEFRTKKFS